MFVFSDGVGKCATLEGQVVKRIFVVCLFPFFLSVKILFEIGAMDEDYVILELNAKVRRGPPSDQDLEPFIEKHFAPQCILFTDKADAYKRMAKKHPELIKYLRQVNHSKGEFTR